MSVDIDIAIVIGFLVVTLIIGLGHGNKVKTIEQYALGDRNFSTGALIATIVASWIGGGTFFTSLSRTYSDGITFILPVYGMVLSFLIMAYVFIPKMSIFLGKLSIAEALGDLYGDKVRIIVALAGTVGAAGAIAVQFKVFGNILSYFLYFSPLEGVLLSAFIVTIYSAFGGIRAVTFTDLLQTGTFGVAVPIISIMIWNHAYYEDISIMEALSNKKFDVARIFEISNVELLSMLALFLYFSVPGMQPDIFQRVSMGRDTKQAKKAFIGAAFLITLILFSVQWVPFLIFSIDSNLEAKDLLGYIVDNYSYTGFKGVLIIGIIALAMSTADSILNSSAVLFGHDICRPLNLKPKSELFISKIFSIIIGIIGVVLALYTQNILQIILDTSSFYMPIVTVPMMLTILGFRTSTRVILAGMAASFVTVIIWKFSEIDIDPIFFAMGINCAFLLGCHYLFNEPGGWITVQDLSEPKDDKMSCLRNFRSYLSFNFIRYCRRNSPINEMSYVSLGVYFIIFTITTMYDTQTCLLLEGCGWILYMYQAMMVFGVVLAVYPIWPGSFNQSSRLLVAQIFWPISIFAILILCNCFFMLISNSSSLQFAIFTANLLIVATLLGWRMAIFSILAGCLVLVSIYSYFDVNQYFNAKAESPAFISIYLLMIVGSTILLFLKPKQEYQKVTEAKVGTLETEVTHLETELSDLSEKVTHYTERVADQSKEIERLGATAQRILNNVNHELRLPVGNVMNFAEMLNDGLGKFSKEQLKALSDEVYKNSNRLSSMILNMLDLATLEAKKIELQKKVVNFSELVHDRVQSCRKIYLVDKKIDIEMHIEENILINIDPNYIRQTIDNLVINAINFSQEGLIKISVLREDGFVEFAISDQGQGIPENELYDIFTPFKMGSKAESKAEGRGVGLALCKAAVEAHGGSISAESIDGKGAKFRFVL